MNEALKALAVFNDGMNALRWLLNHGKESPRKQIGGLMECFTIKENHTSRTDETLERLWESAETIRAALHAQGGDAITYDNDTHSRIAKALMEFWPEECFCMIDGEMTGAIYNAVTDRTRPEGN